MRVRWAGTGSTREGDGERRRERAAATVAARGRAWVRVRATARTRAGGCTHTCVRWELRWECVRVRVRLVFPDTARDVHIDGEPGEASEQLVR